MMKYIIAMRFTLDILASASFIANQKWGWAWMFVGLAIADFATLCLI